MVSFFPSVSLSDSFLSLFYFSHLFASLFRTVENFVAFATTTSPTAEFVRRTDVPAEKTNAGAVRMKYSKVWKRERDVTEKRKSE